MRNIKVMGMSEIKQMRHLLEEMVEAADEGDKDRVIELDSSYEALEHQVYGKDFENPLRLQYDNCRQSCVMSVGGILKGVLKDQHDKLVADAKERLSKIPEPED